MFPQRIFEKRQEDYLDHFYDTLHYHPEIQFMIIEESKGTCFIGDRILEFSPRSVYILRPNFPHLFRNDDIYYQEGNLFAKSTSVFFNKEGLGQHFFELKESSEIAILFRTNIRWFPIKTSIKRNSN